MTAEAYDRYGQHTGVMCLGCGRYVYVLHAVSKRVYRSGETIDVAELRCLDCLRSSHARPLDDVGGRA